jgi:hypothetical protein
MLATVSTMALLFRAFALFSFLSSIASAVSVPHRLPRKDWLSQKSTNVKRQAALRAPEVSLPKISRMPNSPGKCTNPRMRKEWRRLTDDEKKNYLDAVHCMKTSPPKFKSYFPAIRSRYDDFVRLLCYHDIQLLTGPRSHITSTPLVWYQVLTTTATFFPFTDTWHGIGKVRS